MTTLVVGASGATGKLLVQQLLETGQKVKIIIRSTSNFPDLWNNMGQLTIIKENITELSVDKLSGHVADCQSVACCLGHNLTWKGIYGKPRRLVSDSIRLLCEAIEKTISTEPVKFVLMNTTGYRNKDLKEPRSFGERIVIGLLRLMLPPHPDNEKAADYLICKIGQVNPHIEWVVVRPDNLTNEEKITEYSLCKSPTSSPIFNPGKTSRINVGHFMRRLLLDDELWKKWKGQTPVIYNKKDMKN